MGKRNAVQPPRQPLSLRLSESEARAEATYQIMTFLLARLPDREQVYLYSQAKAYATREGLDQIGVEINNLFGDAAKKAPLLD